MQMTGEQRIAASRQAVWAAARGPGRVQSWPPAAGGSRLMGCTGGPETACDVVWKEGRGGEGG